MINRLPWHKKLRTSAANNLDKINEVIDYINHSNISEFALSESGSGRSVQAGKASSLKDLVVFGESIQDGTPTPENPVPVQVVNGKNLIPTPYYDGMSKTQNGVTFTVNPDGTVSTSGTATAAVTYNLWLNVSLPSENHFLSGCPTGGGSTTYEILANTGTGSIYRDYGSGAALGAKTSFSTVQIIIRSGTNANGLVFKPQIELGSTATPYIPYGCIGLQTGDTVTPIDLQGNVLASLPDGTRDELKIDSAGHVWIEKKTWMETISAVGAVSSSGTYASITTSSIDKRVNWDSTTDMASDVGTASPQMAYCSMLPPSQNSIHIMRTWNDIYIYSPSGSTMTQSDIDVLVGATFVARNKTQIIDLGYITPPAISEDDVITVLAAITPEINVSWWSYDEITEVVTDLKAYVDWKIEQIEPTSDSLGMHTVSPIRPIGTTDIEIPIDETEESEMI